MTRYQEIHQAIRKRIFDGEYALNSKLPSEAALCLEFSSSRFTVREALRRLQIDGLVERKQGACARIIGSQPNTAFIQGFETRSELQQYALNSGYKLVATKEILLDPSLQAKIAASSDADTGQPWLLQTGLRLNHPDDVPSSLIETYVSPMFRAQWGELAKRQPPFYSYLEETTGLAITAIEQEIQALSMPPYVKMALGRPATEISLRILRRYKSSSQTVLASFNWHLGEDNFIFSNSLKQQEQRLLSADPLAPHLKP
tara:strand:+ start:609 stop:1382 length:774 start_codon:yes stop_codon:yes gene_type:complete